MPTREAPTARQLRLGVELRKLRERAGINATEAGRILGLGQSRVSNIEVGRIGVSRERVRTFARAYRCGDSDLVEALAAMTSGSRKRPWWDNYRELVPPMLCDLAELEHHATAIRTAQIAHLPGLLQTVDYARLVFRQDIPALSPPEIEHRVSHRIKRQEVLYRSSPTSYTAIIHEAALRIQFGSPEVVGEQLHHIEEMSRKEHVDVRVIPFRAGLFPGAGQTVLYAHGVVPQLDTVQLDSEHGSQLVYSDASLERYSIFMERFEAIALDSEDSRSLIHDIVNSQ